MRIALAWATVAASVGVVSGFTLGQARERPLTARSPHQARAAEPGPAAPAAAAAPAALPSSPSPSPAESRMQAEVAVRCVGRPLEPRRFTAVAGVTDMHAHAVAAAAGLPAALARRFEDLNAASPTARDELANGAVGAASRGPILLVLQLSKGDYQVELAHQVHKRDPRSAIAVVDKSGALQPADLARFPARTVLVSFPSRPDPGGVTAWAKRIHQIAVGELPCSGG